MAKFCGNRPDESKGWWMVDEVIGETLNGQGDTLWQLWCRGEPDEESGWLAVKLVLKPGQPQRRKANFWLAFNGERWARSRDGEKLHVKYPALEEAAAWTLRRRLWRT